MQALCIEPYSSCSDCLLVQGLGQQGPLVLLAALDKEQQVRQCRTNSH